MACRANAAGDADDVRALGSPQLLAREAPAEEAFDAPRVAAMPRQVDNDVVAPSALIRRDGRVVELPQIDARGLGVAGEVLLRSDAPDCWNEPRDGRDLTRPRDDEPTEPRLRQEPCEIRRIE